MTTAKKTIEPSQRNTPLIFVAVMIGFIIVYFLARWPGYQVNLLGEDGIFADIFLNRPPGPNYFQAGRVNGQEIYNPIWHPALNYELLRAAGFISDLVIDYALFSPYQTNLILRLSFSIFQLTVWLLYLGVIFLARKEFSPNSWWFAIALLFIISLSRLAVHTSLELQIDNTAGALFPGLLSATLLLVSFRLTKNLVSLFVVFLGGLLVGLGKNEWGLIFLVSVLVTSGLWPLYQKWLGGGNHPDGLSAWRILIAAGGGCLAGSLVSYLYDPFNYLMGWNLLFKMVDAELVMGNSKIFVWMHLNFLRLPYTGLILLILLYCVWQIIRGKKFASVVELLSLIFSSGLFAAYVLAMWGGIAYRYFGPALISSAATLLLFLPRSSLGISNAKAVIFCSILLLLDILLMPKFPPYRVIPIEPRAECVQVLGVAQGYNRNDIDYLGDTIGESELNQLVNQAGGVLCKP